jgi:hypothetical protein
MVDGIPVAIAAVRIAGNDFGQRARFRSPRPGRQGDFVQFAAQAARIEQHAARQMPRVIRCFFLHADGVDGTAAAAGQRLRPGGQGGAIVLSTSISGNSGVAPSACSCCSSAWPKPQKAL